MSNYVSTVLGPALLAASILPACLNAQSTVSGFAPDSLLVLPNAAKVTREDRYSGIITYNVADEYPAERTIQALSGRLAKANWKPTDDLFNNPGVTAQRKWNMVRIKGRNDFTWTSYWSDPQGNVLSINLRNQMISPLNATAPLTMEKLVRVQIIKYSSKLAQQTRATRGSK